MFAFLLFVLLPCSVSSISVFKRVLSSGCPANGLTSCQSGLSGADTCCVESPGVIEVLSCTPSCVNTFYRAFCCRRRCVYARTTECYLIRVVLGHETFNRPFKQLDSSR